MASGWSLTGLARNAPDQFLCRCRRADLAAMDEEDEGLARFGRRVLVHDIRQARRASAARPGRCRLGPAREILFWIAERVVVLACLEPRIDEVAGHVGDRG